MFKLTKIFNQNETFELNFQSQFSISDIKPAFNHFKSLQINTFLLDYLYFPRNYDKYLKKSHQIRQLIANDFKKAFIQDQTDLILTPTCFHDTPTYAQYLRHEATFDEKDFFTACANIAGLPAISIPSVSSLESGLPVGVQLMANWHQDSLLLNSAHWFIQHNADNFVYSSLNL